MPWSIPGTQYLAGRGVFHELDQRAIEVAQLAREVQLVVNLATARSLGVTIPESVLVRAEKVIEQPGTSHQG